MPTPQLVDVAHWDSPIDVHSMIDAGVFGLYAKATTGAHGVDSAFAGFHAQATNADVQRYCAQKLGCPFFFGAYHWLNGDDPHAQVANFLSSTEGILWRILDFEDPSCSLSTALMATHILNDKQGAWPTMYGSDRSSLGVAIDQGHFAGACPLILARYGPNPPSHKCDWWQYSAGESPTAGASLIGGKAFDLNTFVGAGDAKAWLAKATGMKMPV